MLLARSAAALILAAALTPAQAADRIPGPLPVTGIVSVYDGDTFTATVAIWPGVAVTTSVRVDGADTPEIRGDCPIEKARAMAARDTVRAWLDAAGVVELVDVRPGKYAGRVVARVLLDGDDLAARLIAAGHARPYDGGRREAWCAG